jgi:TolA-binding protein
LTSFVTTGAAPLLNTITDPQSLAGLNQKLTEFRSFNNSLRTQVSVLSKDIDIGRRTQQLGDLRERIKKLEGLEATAREEAETANARLRYVEKRDQDVSYKQLFFLDRPVRQFSVPTFVTLSVLLALLTIRFIYMLYAGVQVGDVSASFLTGVGSAPAAGTGGIGALFGYGQPAVAPGLGGLFSSSGITGQLR